MNETLEKLKESEEKLKKAQQDNINSNSMPDLEKKKEEDYASLCDAFKSFY